MYFVWWHGLKRLQVTIQRKLFLNSENVLLVEKLACFTQGHNINDKQQDKSFYTLVLFDGWFCLLSWYLFLMYKQTLNVGLLSQVWKFFHDTSNKLFDLQHYI